MIDTTIKEKAEEYERKIQFVVSHPEAYDIPETVMEILTDLIEESRRAGYEAGEELFFVEGYEARNREVRVIVEGMKKNRKIPWQALNFSDNCPGCGHESNQTYVDSKCKEIVDEALTDLLTHLNSK